MDKKPSKAAIWQVRKNCGLNIDEAAKQFDVDRTTIIRWEKGSPHIPVKRLEDAEKIYGVNRASIRPDIFEAAQ